MIFWGLDLPWLNKYRKKHPKNNIKRQENFTFIIEFKYLSTCFAPKLKENSNISKQSKAATIAFQSTKKHLPILLWKLNYN